MFAASNNKYTLVEQRDYNYGAGAVGEVEGWLSHPTFGIFMVSFNHYQIYTSRKAALEADLSHDLSTVFRTKYTVPIWNHVSLRLEYTLFYRHLHFTGQSGYNTSECLVGTGLDYRF